MTDRRPYCYQQTSPCDQLQRALNQAAGIESLGVRLEPFPQFLVAFVDEADADVRVQRETSADSVSVIERRLASLGQGTARGRIEVRAPVLPARAHREAVALLDHFDLGRLESTGRRQSNRLTAAAPEHLGDPRYSTVLRMTLPPERYLLPVYASGAGRVNGARDGSRTKTGRGRIDDMTDSARAVLAEALRLDLDARAEIAAELLGRLDGPRDIGCRSGVECRDRTAGRGHRGRDSAVDSAGRVLGTREAPDRA